MSEYKTILKTISIISLLGLIFAISLSITFEKSNPIIEQNKIEFKTKLLNEVLDGLDYDNDLIGTYIRIKPNELLKNKTEKYAYLAKKNNILQAVLIESIAPDGYSGEINILTAIRSDGEIIGTRIIDHKETPGLGDYIDQKKSSWISNFNGMSLNNRTDPDWRVKKDQGTFDYKAGATITPRAVIKSVKNTLLFYKENRELFND
ncbi:MAG: electron transport complex subunit RsxG [Methylophilaceae bacterium]|jgi:electron transport complex protein RnfG|nr:electron transport complex subunit RsxG [Nitrosomonadales bacterium]NCV38403.1 electron transport complex subunit RsxG [Betaproteobacteria bacterium]NCW63367.1 electron transport complex subunit RsxG [Betaproteobacteria bacterium]